MKVPKAVQNKLVGLLAQYILTDGSPVQRQQRAYDAYMKYFLELEEKYPSVPFRSEEVQTQLTKAAKEVAKTKVFRGPGATH